MEVHHVGYLVKHMDSAIISFTELGYRVIKETVYDNYRQIDICFLQNGGMVVELIAPRKENNHFKALAKKIGNAPYHICYIADNLKKDIEKLQAHGWMMIQLPHEAVAIDNRKVLFFFHSEIGMLELVER